MAARVTRTEFIDTLARVEAGLSVRPFIDQSDCYIFDQGWVSTFNDEICCRTKTGLPVDFVGAVHAKTLRTALEAMTAAEVTVDFTAQKVTIRAKDERVAVRLEAEIVLPVDGVTAPELWDELPLEFAEAVKRVAEAAGTKQEEFLATCVHIHPAFVEASDRYQMCRYTVATGAAESFLVRAKSLTPVTNLGVVKMGFTDEWVHFRNRTLVYSCRRHLDSFFELDEQFDFRGPPAELPRGAEQAAKLAGAFCEGKDNDKVIVRLTPGRMVVRGEGGRGEGERDVPMEYAGADLTFRLTPAMLTSLVKSATRCELDGKKLCVRGDHWVYVTALGQPPADGDDGGEGDANDGS